MIKYYYESFDITKDKIFDLIQWYDSFDNLYPGFEGNDGEDCYFESEEKANRFANEIIDLFSSLYTDKIIIYRSIQVDSKEEIDLEMLGNSWSFEEESAKNFASYNLRGNVFFITGITNKDNIDWEKSIELYLNFSGGMSDEDENELYVINYSDIKIISIKQIRKKK